MKKLNLAENHASTMAGAGQRPTESGAIHWSRACGQRPAFTMAEILLSLTIIGVVAAITLPSLTGNINERTWNTQRKALLSRFSQAVALMPSLNGYGVGATDADTINNAAEVFVTSGLSKVLKINNICGYGTDGSTLYDCGFTNQKITNGAGEKVDLPKQLSHLNSGLSGAIPGTTLTIKNTKAAAFESANGEAILTFYNPECKPGNVMLRRNGTAESDFYFRQQICAIFVFDLNGKKGPNTVGKDIGTITVVYPSDSKVVMPMYPRSVALNKTYEEATNICKNLSDGEYRLPNLEELISIYGNKYLVGGDLFSQSGHIAWTTTMIDSTHVFAVGQGEGVKYTTLKTASKHVACVQR